MNPSAELAGALDALSDPVLLVSGERVVFANRRARLDYPGVEGSALSAEEEPEAASATREWLSRCLGSSQPLVGGLRLRGAHGVARAQGFGSRLEVGGRAMTMVRLRRGDDPRFAALNATINELNAEIHRRRASEAALAAAVEERDLLLRELHHRVKNNFHMLVALIKTAAREAAGAEAAAALHEVSQRATAVAAGQRLLYRLDRLEAVEAPALVAAIVDAAMALADGRLRVERDVAPMEVANDRATPIALILNELLTNAIRHAAPAADGAERHVRVRLARKEAQVELSVEDDGQGFDWRPATGRRGSGLGLVAGLAAQLGGALCVERGPTGGARCVVRFICRRAQARLAAEASLAGGAA